MSKHITRFLAFAGCVMLLIFCSKEEPEIDYSDPLSFNCNSSPLICARPDSLGPFGNMDCDNGGISSFYECLAKTDFNNPADDCEAAVKAKVDICLLMQIDQDSVELGFSQTHVLADQDCDGGGLTNYEECIHGFNPIKANDADEENGLLDDKEIEAYLREKNIATNLIQDSVGIIATNDALGLNIIRTESGVLCLIAQDAVGESPTVQDSITYSYTSSYLSNCLQLEDCLNPSLCPEMPFMSSASDTAQVSNLIFGIQEGLGNIKGQSKGTFFVPSRLAYGSVEAFGVPPYSVLIFDIEIDSIF